METAVKKPSFHMNSNSIYDMFVEYVFDEKELQAHGIHGSVGESMKFIYIDDYDIYVATP